MKLSRREVIEAALVTALAAATSETLLGLVGQAVPTSERFLIITLRDGRMLAIDRLNDSKAFLLSRRPASNGDYFLSRSGSVEIRDGNIHSLKGIGASPGYTFASEGNAVVLKTEGGKRVLSVPNVVTVEPKGKALQRHP